VHSAGNAPHFFAHDMEGLYRPLRETLYAVSWDTLGFGAQPLGYQFVGLALHGICCVAFFLLLRRLGVGESAAIVAGAIFAVHPAHVERVAWITASYDLLGPALLLLALLGRAGPIADNGRLTRRDFLWMTALLAALFSAEEAAIFPLLALVVDYAQTAADAGWRRWPRLRRDLIGVGLVVFYFACRYAALGRIDRGRERPAAGFLGNVLAQAVADVRYLRQFIAPWQVNFYHVIPTAHLTASLAAWAALVALSAALAAAFLVRRRRPFAAFGVVWFFIALLPSSQILANRNLFQERYAYLAYGGAALLTGLAAEAVWRALHDRRARAALAAAGAVCLAALAALTDRYTRDFHDDLRLWTRVAARAPDSEKALTNLGASYMALGRFADALPYLQRARQINPRYAPALRDLGESLARTQHLPEAAAALHDYLQVEPQNAEMAAEYARLLAALSPSAGEGNASK
jgi:tetratricopeptide (TPR) repeat protein